MNLEDVKKDYHVVRGEGFVSWFNQSSVFLYDGQRVIDINLVKQDNQD